ncbi:hypothetical protein HaLaN_15193, partial [Haematococcus lacustris]
MGPSGRYRALITALLAALVSQHALVAATPPPPPTPSSCITNGNGNSCVGVITQPNQLVGLGSNCIFDDVGLGFTVCDGK